MWQHKLAGTHRTIYELDVVARDGRRLTLEVNTSLLKWRGRVEGVQGIARDITEHKRRTEELRQATDAAFAAMRAKNTLLTNTGHELRTPLTVILGTAEFLREHASGLSIPALTDRLTAIGRAAQRLRTVIANLIDLSAIEAGQRVQQAEDFAVCEMLTEIVARLQATLNLHENRLVIDCAATERMFTDRSKLRAIMFNLLDYAAKATQHDELRLEVSVLLHNGAPWLNFLIADSEAGRSRSPLDLDFDDLSLTTGIAATQSVDDDGLGLPLANYYCQLLGGYLLINNAPGRSARFEVRLPQVAISE
jgi:signal transduction histidine kinase